MDPTTLLWITDPTMSLGDVINVVTGLIVAGFTGLLYKLAKRQDEHFQKRERAYVTITPYVPGISFGDDSAHIAIRIQNAGSTPARIERYGIRIVLTDGEAPVGPNDASISTTDVDTLLVQGDAFNAQGQVALTREQRAAVGGPSKKVFLVGFVDYEDIFKRRHRRGFCRQYSADLDNTSRPEYRRVEGGSLDPEKYRGRLNLTMPALPGYNFDTRRKK